MVDDKLKQAIYSNKDREVVGKLINRKKAVFARFPLLFTLLGSFGLVATFYGFERVIDDIGFFSDNPYVLLGTGLIILIITGTLYKKLQ